MQNPGDKPGLCGRGAAMVAVDGNWQLETLPECPGVLHSHLSDAAVPDHVNPACVDAGATVGGRVDVVWGDGGVGLLPAQELRVAAVILFKLSCSLLKV